MDEFQVTKAAENLLIALFGETVFHEDENFIGTPERMAKAYKELLSGEEFTIEQVRYLFKKEFPTTYDGSISCVNHKTD